jgi:hypothetical protein
MGITQVTTVAGNDLTTRKVSKEAMWDAIGLAKSQLGAALLAKRNGDEFKSAVFIRAALATLCNIGAS